MTKRMNGFKDLMKDYFAIIEDFTDGISNIELLMPAITVITRMFILSKIDQSKPGGKELKEIIYLVEREVIGAWIIKNCQSTVGEGAGLMLMGLAPFMSDIGKGSKELMDDAKVAWQIKADADEKLLKIVVKYLTFGLV